MTGGVGVVRLGCVRVCVSGRLRRIRVPPPPPQMNLTRETGVRVCVCVCSRDASGDRSAGSRYADAGHVARSIFTPRSDPDCRQDADIVKSGVRR